jgi:hypothetical protein
MGDKCWFKWTAKMSLAAWPLGKGYSVDSIHHCDRTYQHDDEFHKCKCGTSTIEDADREVHDG